MHNPQFDYEYNMIIDLFNLARLMSIGLHLIQIKSPVTKKGMKFDDIFFLLRSELASFNSRPQIIQPP